MTRYASDYFHYDPDIGTYRCECGAVVHHSGARWEHVNRTKQHAGGDGN